MRYARVYKAGVHFGEEGLVQGNHRSGMVTFSGCHLACNHCYTPETSVDRFGTDYDDVRFQGLLESLVQCGAKNLNFVSPTHEWSVIEKPLLAVAQKLAGELPIVLKISGYEGAALIRRMAIAADVWVPDFKVFSREAAARVNLPLNYGTIAQRAIETMLETHCVASFSTDGKLRRGIVVRHLLMPGFLSDSLDVLDALADTGFRGPLNFMTHFVDTTRRALCTADPRSVGQLVERASARGLEPLVDGKAVTVPGWSMDAAVGGTP